MSATNQHPNANQEPWRSFAPAPCCAEPCVTLICESQGKAFVVYLRDGMKITVGRDKTTKGAAWLEVSPQARITAAQHNK